MLIREATPLPTWRQGVAAAQTTPSQSSSAHRQTIPHRNIRSSPISSGYYFDPRRAFNTDRPYTQTALYVRTPNGVGTVGADNELMPEDDITPSRYYERQYGLYDHSPFSKGGGPYRAYDDAASSFMTPPHRRHHYRSSHIDAVGEDANIIHPAHPDSPLVPQMLRQEPSPTSPSIQEGASIRTRGTPPPSMRDEYTTPPPSPPRHSTPTLSSTHSPQFEDLHRKRMCRGLEILEDFDDMLSMIIELREMQREHFREGLDEARGIREKRSIEERLCSACERSEGMNE
jgi:hypothetical protein